MERTFSSPPRWRVILGFTVGPGVAVLAFACASPLYMGLSSLGERIILTAETTAFVVYPITLVFGVPTYLCLRRRLRPSVLNCALAGAGVSAFPWLLLSLLAIPDEASTDGVVTAHNHMLTLAGWLEDGKMVGFMAGLGAIAGLTFWCAVLLGGRSRQAEF